MLLKRKRSSSELSFDATSSADAGSLAAMQTDDKSPTTWTMFSPWNLATRSIAAPLGRAIKRLRASQEPVSHFDTPSQAWSPAVTQWDSQPSSDACSETNSAASSPALTTDSFSFMHPTAMCEQCGRSLADEPARPTQDAMDIDTDVESRQLAAGMDRSCSDGCGRHVCSQCSIVTGDDARRCVRCAESDSLPVIMSLAKQLGVGWTGFTRGHRILWRLA